MEIANDNPLEKTTPEAMAEVAEPCKWRQLHVGVR